MQQFLETVLGNTLPFLFVLGLIVTIHELGHFLAGKACGVGIDCFSIGFGRPLVSWRDRSGVEWRIAWIPLGGYVRFAGDENATSSAPSAEDLADLKRNVVANFGRQALRRYLVFRPLWQRAFVAAAGPFANFVLSTVLFAVLLATIGERTLPARVDAVQPAGAAARAGFQPGDLVLRADDEQIDSFQTLQQYVQIRPNVPIRFDVRRGAGEVILTATPTLGEIDPGLGGKQKAGLLGIEQAQRPGDMHYRRYNPVEAVGGGAARTWEILKMSVYVIGRLVQGQLPADGLRGPVGIAQLSGAVVHAGVAGAPNLLAAVRGVAINLLTLAAVISVSIGFMNHLPVPVLDGGHLLFYAYEAVARRPLAAAVQAAGYRVGLALLLGLMLFATWNDLQRLRVFHLLGGLFS